MLGTCIILHSGVVWGMHIGKIGVILSLRLWSYPWPGQYNFINLFLNAFFFFFCNSQDQTQARTTDIDSGEILDEIVTRSRGEIRRIQSPKITSVSPTPLQNINHSHSPRVSESTYSPRVRELRRERSAGLSGQGIEIKHSSSPRPSGLGKNSHGSPPV